VLQLIEEKTQVVKVQTTYWDAEDNGMVTEDSDKMFYQMEKKK
jgi:hypothetical protein